MEIDFLNEALRIAVELDGSQHFSDAEAYRRDRRKDRLLQQNGYLVLRFLAEDVGKDLDGVLDATLQSLASRDRSGSSYQVNGGERTTEQRGKRLRARSRVPRRDKIKLNPIPAVSNLDVVRK